MVVSPPHPGEGVAPSEITIYSSTGHLIDSAGLDLLDTSEHTLAEVHRQHVDDSVACYATLRRDRVLLALYLAAPWVPRSAVYLQRARTRTGCWLTSRLQLGAPGLGRAWVGPRLFLRQLDVGEVDAWLAPVLLGLVSRHEPRLYELPDQPIHSWEMGGSRYYYTARGASFHLYGGGNTPEDRLQQVLGLESPSTASEFLWSIGAVKLA